MNTLDETHDLGLMSWVESANDPATDFPIQNLPLGRFRRAAEEEWRIGTAIGDQILDLGRAGFIATADMNALMAAGAEVRRTLRLALSQGLRHGSPDSEALRQALVPQSEAEMGLPCRIGDYTDFYTGIHHARTVGSLFRPDHPLLPNYKWVPIGYHGRASSIVVSGWGFHRPLGQTKAPEETRPSFGPSRRLDYELEVGALVSIPNALGSPVPMAEAEAHLCGLVLLNDWSARDIQAWEYQPLGPFLSKSFATTVSPWIITLEALQPFRATFRRPSGDPDPLPYLDSTANRSAGSFAITLEVWLQTARQRESGEPGQRLMASNYSDGAYWTLAQLVAHHTVNGCNLQSGDLLGSGTLSGPEAGQGGSLLELTQGGRQPLRLGNGETRTFLEDGDRVTLKGYCEGPGSRRIGFGECTGTVLPARS